MRGSLERWVGVVKGVGVAGAVGIVLALAGCGDDDSGSGESAGGGAAKSGEEIKIGVEAGLTGASNQIGVPYVNGAKMAAEDLNAEADTVLNGGSVKLVTADTETE